MSTKGNRTEEKENADSMKFETALERLESIVESMEQGKMSLDEMLGSFEEGRKLIELCNQKLNEVERRIETLIKKDNAIVAEPLDASAVADPG